MRKSCQYCGRSHDVGYACARRPAAKRHAKEPTRVVKFRRSYTWAKKSAEIQARDSHLCKLCASEGRLTYEGIEVHHIEPLSERFDLRLEDGNLVSLCGKCHEKAERGIAPRALLKRLAAKNIPPLLFDRKTSGKVKTTQPSVMRKKF